jgi:hypothetical protein
MEAFAVAYADPTSGTYGIIRDSVRSVAPEYQPGSCNSVGARWLKNPIVLDKIDEIRRSSRAMAALTPGEYVKRALEMTEKLIARDGRGDAGAASKFFELAGKAAGLLVQKTEDMTPLERKFPTAEYSMDQLESLLGRMRALQESNPLPPGQIARVSASYTPPIQEDPHVREVEPDGPAVPGPTGDGGMVQEAGSVEVEEDSGEGPAYDQVAIDSVGGIRG